MVLSAQSHNWWNSLPADIEELHFSKDFHVDAKSGTIS